MAICTMLVVIPFWCNRPEEPEEDVRDDQMVVEAQPAPEVEAEPLMPSGTTMRPMSELQVRPPAARAPSSEPRLMGPEVVAPNPVTIEGEVQGAPDPRLYGMSQGTALTTTGSTSAPPAPVAQPAPTTMASAPVEEPMQAPELRSRSAPVQSPTPRPQPTYEPQRAPDTADVALYQPGSEPTLPASPEVRRPASAPATRPAPAAPRAVPMTSDGQRNLAALLAAGEITATEPVEYESASAHYEAEGIAQRKNRRYRRAVREEERAERRARRQGG